MFHVCSFAKCDADERWVSQERKNTNLNELHGKQAGAKETCRQGDAVEKLPKRTDSFNGNKLQDLRLRVDTNLNAVFHEGATILQISENVFGEITEEAAKDAVLDTVADKMLFYLLTSACKGELC